VRVVGDDSEQEARVALYRQSARNLRQLAAEIRFDFRRRSQLLALADGFDRYVARIEGSPVAHAVD
jgi:hypothetical protein